MNTYEVDRNTLQYIRRSM